jgi:hypothetical protein
MLASVLASSLVPIVVCIAAGSATRGQLGWPGADMLVGFGLLSSALSILAVTTRIPLSWLMMGLATLWIIALLMRRQCPGGSSTWIALALVSPILVGAAGSKAAMWDDFWNWLPNAAYAYSHDSLVWPDLPPSFSIFPSYPQGMPLMVAAASFMAGRFLEAAGPICHGEPASRRFARQGRGQNEAVLSVPARPVRQSRFLVSLPQTQNG